MRQRLWQNALARRSLPLLAAAAALRAGHAVGNNTKAALMTGLLLFKVPPRHLPRPAAHVQPDLVQFTSILVSMPAPVLDPGTCEAWARVKPGILGRG